MLTEEKYLWSNSQSQLPSKIADHLRVLVVRYCSIWNIDIFLFWNYHSCEGTRNMSNKLVLLFQREDQSCIRFFISQRESRSPAFWDILMNLPKKSFLFDIWLYLNWLKVWEIHRNWKQICSFESFVICFTIKNLQREYLWKFKLSYISNTIQGCVCLSVRVSNWVTSHYQRFLSRC